MGIDELVAWRVDPDNDLYPPCNVLLSNMAWHSKRGGQEKWEEEEEIVSALKLEIG